jgi:hypothetical protein
MHFRLSMLFLFFVVLCSSLAVFGGWGILVFIILVWTASCIARSLALMVLPVIVLVMALFLPIANRVRLAVLGEECGFNMQQIALALRNYEAKYHCLPPAYTCDKDGRPIHSWRVLILPFLECTCLYDQYRFNEPWDSPNNRKLLASRPNVYACYSDSDVRGTDTTWTSYVAVVGANAAWPGERPGKLPDDPSKTVLIVETAGAGIRWTEPKDLSLDALLAASPGCLTVSSKHFPNEFFTRSLRVGAYAALANGNRPFLSGGLLASDKFPDLLKVGGFREEYIKTDWCSVGRRIDWTNCAWLAVWLASSGWLLVRAARSRKKVCVSAVE